MTEQQNTISNTESHKLKSYVYGFVFSLVLTLVAYVFVIYHVFSPTVVVALILALALLQLIVQLVFFIHLNREKGPRLNSLIFFTTLTGIVILVGGSIWIMGHLNYHMLPVDINTHIMEEEAIYR